MELNQDAAMLSTVLLVISLTVLFGIAVLLWAYCLGVGLRWAKAEPLPFRKRLAVSSAVQGCNALLGLGGIALGTEDFTNEIVLLVGQYIAYAVLGVLAINWAFSGSFRQACFAWLPTIAANISVAAIMMIVFLPFFFEAFSPSSNSMAPTILGPHVVSECEVCGEPCYASALPDRLETHRPIDMICEQFHVSQPELLSQELESADRFLVAKFLKPRRWDLVAFVVPGRREEVLYVKRLVGLPGETIIIRDGQVWVNGKKLALPPSLAGLEYVTESPGGFKRTCHGSPESPAVLGENDYFVLGDFTQASLDSRWWKEPAVPGENIKGVVSHRFYPFSRVRAFR